MKLLSEIPKEGQFAVIHEYNGVIWAGTMRWNGVILERFCDAADEFIEDDRDENTDINYKYLQDLD